MYTILLKSLGSVKWV